MVIAFPQSFAQARQLRSNLFAPMEDWPWEPHPCYHCGRACVLHCYYPVLLCMDCDARARSLFLVPFLRQRLLAEPPPDVVTSIAKFAGPCLDMRRRLYYLRALFECNFSLFTDVAPGGVIRGGREDILDRILSYLGFRGTRAQIWRRPQSEASQRSLYVVRDASDDEDLR